MGQRWAMGEHGVVGKDWRVSGVKQENGPFGLHRALVRRVTTPLFPARVWVD
jgi:hypothetical protein